MFTGIVETVGTVKEIRDSGTNRTFTIASSLAPELSIDQSLSHNGVCLTVEAVDAQAGQYQVTAIEETLKKSMLGSLKVGSGVNLERSMGSQGRMDGHFVLGHVDATGSVVEIIQREGSREYVLSYPPEFEALVVYKGSIALNGISLTIAESYPENHRLMVAIIPYTLEHTNLKDTVVGDSINLEFDILGKYVKKTMDTMNLKPS